LGTQKEQQLKNALVTTGKFSINFRPKQSEYAKRPTLFQSHSYVQPESI